MNLASKGMKPKSIAEYLTKNNVPAKVPTVRSIRNYLKRTNFVKNEEAKISIGEMIEWFQANLNAPNDNTAPFVLNYECSETMAEEKYFRFAITSKLLLNNCTKSNILHADATYKLVWQGFPVLILGCSDKKRSFHPIVIGVSSHEKQADFEFFMKSIKTAVKTHFDETYAPGVLVADAAAAIGNAFSNVFPKSELIVMCFAHVMANLKKRKLCDNSNWPQIKVDVNHLPLAPTKTIFQKAQKCFITKYEPIEPDFCNYMQSEWLEKNNSWFEGIMHLTSSAKQLPGSVSFCT